MNIIFNTLIILLILVFITVWGYSIYHVTITKFRNKNIKLFWTIVIFLIPISSIYYLIYNRSLK